MIAFATDPPPLDTFIDDLAAGRAPHRFNPWGCVCPWDASTDAPAWRRQRLREHLAIDRPSLILVGEGLSYQGGRYSGMAFTAERHLLDGWIPRVTQPTERLTVRHRPFSEHSGTTLWRILHELGLAGTTVVWNAVPWHPYDPATGIHTNRKPHQGELDAGEPFLVRIRQYYPDAPLVAVGRSALAAMQRAGLEPAAQVRHPAFGGASAFQAGIRAIAARSA